MKLKVISFNIRCCDDKDGNSIIERAPRLYSVMSLYDADVIGFQEYRPKWEEHIERLFLDEYDMYVKYRNETVDIEAAPILWKKDKFDCIKTGCFWYSDTPDEESMGWDEKYNCYRQCVYVILKEKISQKCFTFMNTHFGFGDNCHIKSAKLLKEYSKKISDYPTFIAGDFNMNTKTKGYEEITKHFVDINALCDNDLSDTYHAYKPEIFRDSHIDFIFADENVKPIKQTVIKDTVDGMYPSDHFGIYSEIEIK